MELLVNCGYARTAIRKYSELGKGKKFIHSNVTERAQKLPLYLTME